MLRKIISVSVIVIILLALVTTGSVSSAGKEQKVSVIIVFKDRPGQDDKKFIEGQGGSVSYEYSIIDGIAVEVPQHVYEKLIYMQNNPDDSKNPGIAKRIKFVELDQEVHIAVKPVKPTPTPTVTPTPTATPTPTPQQPPWGVSRINAPDAWPSTTGARVNVSVIDTGIDYNHPDLKDNVKGGVTFVRGTSTYMDDNGHGTHCAGIIAAVDNSQGVVGVAPGASLYGVKVLDRRGSGTMSNVIKGIEWATNNDMDVISMSLGGGGSDALKLACDNAYNSGIVVVAAAGNDYEGPISYPAAYGSVIAVTATDSSDEIASFSNIGSDAELAAPGVSIYSTYKGGGYATMSGTSMATPHVAGTAALVIAKNPSLSAAEVRGILTGSAIDLGANGQDDYYGYGLVDAAAATA